VVVATSSVRSSYPDCSCLVIEDSAQSAGAGPVRGTRRSNVVFSDQTLGALGDGGGVLRTMRRLPIESQSLAHKVLARSITTSRTEETSDSMLFRWRFCV